MTRDQDRPYFRHKTRPGWGVGVLVEETTDHRTFLFADGNRRSFKPELCGEFIEPAEPPTDEEQARLARGVAYGGKATPKAINLELEAQIVASPDDPAPYLVYADWLQTKRDPRGLLITLQHQLELAKTDRNLLQAQKKLLDEQGRYLMPESLDAMLRRQRGGTTGDHCEATWRLGFLDHVFLAKRPRQLGDIDAIVHDLLLHPSSHFLRGLTIGALGTPDQYSYVSVIAALTRVKHPLLRDLVIGDFPPSMMELAFTRTGNVSPLLASLPALRRLRLRAGTIRFETNVKHAMLEELSIEASELTATSLQRICRATLPELRSLAIACPSLDLGPDNLRVLLGAKGMPRLERLSLGEQTFDVRAERLSEGGPLTAAIQGDSTRGGEAVAVPDVPITDAEVVRRASDARSITAARAIAEPAKWLELGRDPDGNRYWGEFEGRDHYYVLSRVDSAETSCTCASPKNPCKHSLALLLLAAAGHAFETRPVPSELVRQTRERPRYFDSSWE